MESQATKKTLFPETILPRFAGFSFEAEAAAYLIETSPGKTDELLVHAVRKRADGTFYAGPPMDWYGETDTRVVGLRVLMKGLVYAQPDWIAGLQPADDMKEVWAAFETGLTADRFRYHDVTETVPFPEAIIMAIGLTSSAPMPPTRVTDLSVDGTTLNVSFETADGSAKVDIEVDTSKDPWELTSAVLNGEAVDLP